MPQTLLALLALVVASLLIFNQQRLTTQAQTRMVTDEIELAASGLTSDILEFAEARSFDEATTPPVINAAQSVPASADRFSAATLFGPADRGAAGCDLLQPGLTPECDDLDDLGGLASVPVDVVLANDRRVPFTATLTVDYVTDAESMTPSPARTLHKRVSISLRSPFVRRGQSDVLRATRVISYDPVKAEKDHEDVFGAIGI
jgi:hypothetical protein